MLSAAAGSGGPPDGPQALSVPRGRQTRDPTGAPSQGSAGIGPALGLAAMRNGVKSPSETHAQGAVQETGGGGEGAFVEQQRSEGESRAVGHRCSAAGPITRDVLIPWGGRGRAGAIHQLLGAADAQTAHPATSSTAPTHQLLGCANAETTPARAPAAAADRTQRPDATCEGKTVKEQQPDGLSHRGGHLLRVGGRGRAGPCTTPHHMAPWGPEATACLPWVVAGGQRDSKSGMSDGTTQSDGATGGATQGTRR